MRKALQALSVALIFALAACADAPGDPGNGSHPAAPYVGVGVFGGM